jgi:hypothetical protein
MIEILQRGGDGVTAMLKLLLLLMMMMMMMMMLVSIPKRATTPLTSTTKLQQSLRHAAEHLQAALFTVFFTLGPRGRRSIGHQTAVPFDNR